MAIANSCQYEVSATFAIFSVVPASSVHADLETVECGVCFYRLVYHRVKTGYHLCMLLCVA